MHNVTNKDKLFTVFDLVLQKGIEHLRTEGSKVSVSEMERIIKLAQALRKELKDHKKDDSEQLRSLSDEELEAEISRLLAGANEATSTDQD